MSTKEPGTRPCLSTCGTTDGACLQTTKPPAKPVHGQALRLAHNTLPHRPPNLCTNRFCGVRIQHPNSSKVRGRLKCQGPIFRMHGLLKARGAAPNSGNPTCIALGGRGGGHVATQAPSVICLAAQLPWAAGHCNVFEQEKIR